MRFALLIAVMFALVCATADTARAATYRISDDGASLLVTTQHLECTFDGPDLVGLRNLLTGETYTAAASDLDKGLARIRVRNAGGVQLPPGRWRMLTGTYGAAYEVLPSAESAAEYALRITADAGRLVLVCEGEVESPGVCGITWGISNLDLKAASAVLPARGGRILTAESSASAEEFDYPTHWEAQFALICGRKGTARVYSTDQDARFKRLSYLRIGDAYQLVFGTDNPAPFDDLTKARSVEWRIDCAKGDWRSAVSAYKEEMRALGGGLYRRPEAAAKQSWTKDIRAVVRIHGDYSDTRILDELARHVQPRKTLLYLPNWRRDGYDVNYPDYTGRPGLAEFTKHAQKLGFRVLFHVDLPGVTPSNEAFERVKRYQVKDAMSGQPVGWLWDKDVPQRFAFINPASSQFRRIFVDAMRGIVRDYGPDAVHLDVSGPMWNDGNGPIEGMNYCQGSIQLHRDLLKALPDLVLGGESVNELVAPFEHFVQRWAWPCDLAPHPVCEFLFGDTTCSYGYLGQPNPDQSPSDFLRYVKVYEPQGVLPSTVVGSLADVRPGKLGAARWFNVIRAWQEHDLRPDWGTEWSDDTLFALRGSDGVTASITRSGHTVKMVCDGRAIYERIEGANRVKTRGHIPGHAAYSAGEAFGLDPERAYWVEKGRPKLREPRISRISGRLVVDETRISDDLVAFSFRPLMGHVLLDMVDEIGRARPSVVLDGRRSPLERGAMFARTQASVQGVVMKGILEHPPWLPPAGQTTNPGGRTSGIYTVRILPASEGPCWLEFKAGISDAAQTTDGVTFIVRVDGKEAFGKHVTSDCPWQSAQVDLSSCAGREIEIELLSDPGPAGDTAWDHAVWGQPRVVVNRAGQTSEMDIELAEPPVGAIISGERTAEAAAGTAAIKTMLAGADILSEDDGVALPCSAYFFYREPSDIELPCDLLSLPYTTGQIVAGTYRRSSAWGSGTTETLTLDGEQCRGVNAHPPARGQTTLTWLLRLPDSPKCKLAFTAAVKPNAATDGVGFSVKVNGATQWTRAERAPGSWSGEVDLSYWAGKPIVLELVTDSLGEPFFDWATWARPRIVDLKNSSPPAQPQPLSARSQPTCSA